MIAEGALLAATLAFFLTSDRLARRHPFPLLNPVLVTPLALMALLVALRIPYELYARATAVLTWLLGPATVALAVPLWRQLPRLRQRLSSALPALMAGVLVAVASVLLPLRLARMPGWVLRSLVAKATTTPIALAITRPLGGVAPLTAGAVIVAGITGATFGPGLLTALGVGDPLARGLGMGTASHGIGTARALREGEATGAAASTAIVLAGLATALLAPLALALSLR